MTSKDHFQPSELTQPVSLNAVPWNGVDERRAFSSQLDLALWDTDPCDQGLAVDPAGLNGNAQPARRPDDLAGD